MTSVSFSPVILVRPTGIPLARYDLGIVLYKGGYPETGVLSTPEASPYMVPPKNFVNDEYWKKSKCKLIHLNTYIRLCD